MNLLGGGKRDRTADLLHAMQALSQLSYTPESKPAFYTDFFRRCKRYFVVLIVNRSVTRSLGNRRIHRRD
ncbi:hypothetical protein THICB1_10138 [Thiomonas arsenitoxydans]|uniref:Uncharacterized protein n=1 Tax=Thiomonas arsenitoxydans (strain DSM 22701 / CIP 110005 / 3As) TaxID=426114 RepID=A0ABP1YZV9_THIA3|nr:hypothetical protein THICB1_10138 [Thiomonas arsenitoxydans]